MSARPPLGEATEHRNENRGDECWRSFAPSDIREMINFVARDMHLDGPPTPAVPEEDKPL